MILMRLFIVYLFFFQASYCAAETDQAMFLLVDDVMQVNQERIEKKKYHWQRQFIDGKRKKNYTLGAGGVAGALVVGWLSWHYYRQAHYDEKEPVISVIATKDLQQKYYEHCLAALAREKSFWGRIFKNIGDYAIGACGFFVGSVILNILFSCETNLIDLIKQNILFSPKNSLQQRLQEAYEALAFCRQMFDTRMQMLVDLCTTKEHLLVDDCWYYCSDVFTAFGAVVAACEHAIACSHACAEYDDSYYKDQLQLHEVTQTLCKDMQRCFVCWQAFFVRATKELSVRDCYTLCFETRNNFASLQKSLQCYKAYVV